MEEFSENGKDWFSDRVNDFGENADINYSYE